MPLPRQKPPLDDEATLAVKESMKPVDETVVCAKTDGGQVVEMLSGGEKFTWPDGVRKHYRPVKYPISEDSTSKLETGVAENWEFHWVTKNDRWLARQQGVPGWIPVKRAENLVYCPYAQGNKTDGLIHMMDMILHKRPFDVAEKRRAQKSVYMEQSALLERQHDAAGESLESAMSQAGRKVKLGAGVKVKQIQTVAEPVESQKVRFVQPE